MTTIDHGTRWREVYRRMRGRQLGLAFAGYAVFYFVRKNISVGMPLMEKELGVGKTELGAFLTAGDSVYGVSKLANGFAGILVLAGWLGQNFGWRAVFLVPAGIALATAAGLAVWLRDTPRSLGLPPVEVYRAAEGERPAEVEPGLSPAEYKAVLRRRVFGNRVVWLASIANFFVYTVRLSFLNRAPTFLSQEKHVRLDMAAPMTAGFELAGLVGALSAGWLTDRVFATRRAPICTAYMLATAASVFAFWQLPEGNLVGAVLLLLAIGFTVYGPQFLVGVMVADQAGKHAAAAAIGLTAIFGYASSMVSGLGLGAILEHHGWNGGFALLAAAALVGAIPFALCWNARPVSD
jgi:sugar phosphate permease